MLVEDETVLLHNVLAKHHGQELVVGDMLDHSGNDVAKVRLLIEVFSKRLPQK